jgi:hypothetical protein
VVCVLYYIPDFHHPRKKQQRPLFPSKSTIVPTHSRMTLAFITFEAPAAFFTLKLTVFAPFAALKAKGAAVEYALHVAPVKVELWLAI